MQLALTFDEIADPLMFEPPCGNPKLCHTHICYCHWRARQDLTLEQFKQMNKPKKGSTIESVD